VAGIAPGVSCGGAQGVREARGSPAATNCPERLAAYRTPSSGKGSAGRGSGGWDAEAAEGEGEEQLWLRRGVGSLGVRVVRATAPAPPADALQLDPIQVLRLLEARGNSGAGQGAGSGAVQRGGPGRRGAAGGGETEERGPGARRKKKGEAPTCGSELAAREKKEGVQPGAGPCWRGK
jgi:hypothetical protein